MKLPKKTTITIICWLILIAAILYAYNFQLISKKVTTERKIPLKKPFIYFPFEINGWAGKEQIITDNVFRLLKPSDILMRQYENKEGEKVDLFFAFFENLQDRGPHAPQICWIGHGWSFKGLGIEKIKLDCSNCPEIQFNKILATKDGDTLLLFYFYRVNKNYFANLGKAIGLANLNAFLKGKGAIFTLQLNTPVNNINVASKEKLLKDFLIKITTLLETEYLP